MSEEMILLHEKIKKSTNTQAMVNLMKTCLGSGLLALPILFQESGIIESCLMTIIIGLWVYSCAKKLVKTETLLLERMDPYRTKSIYSEICYQAFGRIGEKTFNILMSITLIGIGIAYTLNASDMISKLPWDKIGLEFLQKKFFAILFVTLFLIPVNLLRDMTSLSFSSLLGNIAILSCISLVIIFGFIYNNMSTVLHDIKWIETSINGLSNLYGTLLFSFGVIFVSLPTVCEMESPDDFKKVLNITATSSALLYCVCNTLLYILFHNEEGGLRTNILYNMGETSPFYYTATILVSLMCVFSYPVTVMPALQLYEPKANDNDNCLFTRTPKKILFRLVVLIFVSLIANIFPNFNMVVSLLGNVTITLITFILPPLLYLKLLGPDSTRTQLIHNGFLIVVGTISMLFMTISSFIK